MDVQYCCRLVFTPTISNYHEDQGIGWCRELVKPGGFDMWPFHPDLSSANNFISHKVQTIHLGVRMSLKVGLNFIRLQIPYLPTHHQKTSVNSTKGRQKTLSVLTIVTSINQQPTISTPRKPVHGAYMTSKCSDELARPALPYTYAVIPSSQRCPPTFQGQSDVRDLVLVAC